MAGILRDEIIRPGSVSALQKDVVLGIARNLKPPHRSDPMIVPANELEQLMSKAFANLDFRSCEYGPILRENGR